MGLAKSPSFRSQAGFTLIDMLVVVAIIGLVSAIALPSTTSMMSGYKIKGNAQAISHLVGLAKMRAAAQFTRARVYADFNARTFRLGCTPVVNLFEQVAEPILLTQRATEYAVVPDVRRRLEIETWSVDSVMGVTPGQGEPHSIEPLYGFRHGRAARTARGAAAQAPMRLGPSGTPCVERPGGGRTVAPRCSSPLPTCRDNCARPTPKLPLSRSPASTATCRAGCRSVWTSAAISSWRRADRCAA